MNTNKKNENNTKVDPIRFEKNVEMRGELPDELLTVSNKGDGRAVSVLNNSKDHVALNVENAYEVKDDKFARAAYFTNHSSNASTICAVNDIDDSWRAGYLENNSSTKETLYVINKGKGPAIKTEGDLHVDGKVKENGNDLIPAGTIIMWSGDKIPEGWHPCDGAAYKDDKGKDKLSPNLIDRFIRGGKLENKGKTGGQNETLWSNLSMDIHIKRGRGGEGWSRSNDSGSYFTNCKNVLDKETTRTRLPLDLYPNKDQENNVCNGYGNLPPYYTLMYLIKK